MSLTERELKRLSIAALDVHQLIGEVRRLRRMHELARDHMSRDARWTLEANEEYARLASIQCPKGPP